MTQAAADQYVKKWEEGQVSRSGPRDDWTYNNEDASIMKVPYAVIKGTDPTRQAKKPVAAFTFDQFAGIIVNAVGISEKQLSTGEIDIESGQSFTVLRKGKVIVRFTQNFTEGNSVFFVHTAGGASAQWTYRVDLDTDKASKIPAKCLSSGLSGELGEIELNVDLRIGTS
jgi:hypothetical protein